MERATQTKIPGRTFPLELAVPGGLLGGELVFPEAARGLVLFAHGSGSSRFSPRNRSVSAELGRSGFATLLFDLLTQEEERADQLSGHLRFDIELLSRRLLAATWWAAEQKVVSNLRFGYFGDSTGAAAALMAAAEAGDRIKAVVSRGGRPDLAGSALPRVEAATLLIVGGRDEQVLDLNQGALKRLRCPRRLVVVPGATHLFEEPGALEEVSRLASVWFREHLSAEIDSEETRKSLEASVRGE